MAIAVIFTPKSMSVAQYNDIIKRLEKAEANAPPDRLYHVCYGPSNQLHVTDVWESQEIFEKFGQTLMPILQQVGVDPGQPAISSTHNVIK
jgi:hypothetical protein